MIKSNNININDNVGKYDASTMIDGNNGDDHHNS